MTCIPMTGFSHASEVWSPSTLDWLLGGILSLFMYPLKTAAFGLAIFQSWTDGFIIPPS